MAGALAQLREGGVPVDEIPEEVQKALDDLSPEEVQVMISVREKLRATGVGDEVEGYRMAADNNVSGNGFFYH